MKTGLLIVMLGSSSLLFFQTVCTGTKQQCADAQKPLCAKDIAPANFDLPADARVTGSVQDQTGAKFDSGIAVQLRDPKTETVLRSAKVEDGEFTLGAVQSGSYRLIVVRQGKRGAERLGRLRSISHARWTRGAARIIAAF